MLTTLPNIKARLGLPDADTQYDTLLTSVIAAVSARFDLECNRTFARTENAIQEFSAEETEIPVACYPIEALTGFETKSSEALGWVQVDNVDAVIRLGCVVSISSTLGSARQQARLVYTGGYGLPGAEVSPGQTALPPDLQHAAIEQVAVWFQNKDKLGLLRHWPSSGTYVLLSQQPLLPGVTAVLKKYERWRA